MARVVSVRIEGKEMITDTKRPHPDPSPKERDKNAYSTEANGDLYLNI